MDLFSHAFLGFVFGQALQLESNAQIILFVSSVILDIDGISIPGWNASFQFHRGPLHSILGAILVSLSISTVYTIFLFPSAETFVPIVLICLGATFGHIFLDLLTTGSMAVLWPFSSKRVAFDLSYFFDPAAFGVLLLASILVIYVKNTEMIQAVMIVTIVLLTVNFGVRHYTRNVAIETVGELMRTQANADRPPRVVPMPTFRLDRWWIVVEIPLNDGCNYEVYKVDSISNKILSNNSVKSPLIDHNELAKPARTHPVDSPQEAIAYSKRDGQVITFIAKSCLPAVNVTLSNDGNSWQVFWYDLFERLSGVSRGVMVRVEFDGIVVADFCARLTFSL